MTYPGYSSTAIMENRRKALAAFDQGKAEFNSKAFLRTAQKSFEEIPEDARVLVLRSARPWFVSLALEALSTFRNVAPDLLAQDEILDHFKKQKGLGQMYSYGSGFFSPECLSEDLKAALCERQYDVLMIPAANNHLAGYKNVFDVAKQLNAKSIVAVFPEGDIKILL